MYISYLSYSAFNAPELLISSKSAVRSFGFFIAIDSTAPWNTRKFFALTLIPSCSNSLRYTWLVTTYIIHENL